jgi:3-deoxy-D-manno-octulosonate 8-phosphate phosphatase KdsC-like HAD superfamily phosphatase
MLSEFLKIPSAEIVTIGDMPNDVFMFKKSVYSIAMGQASEEVKKSATYVTAGMDEEGFAKAVEQFVLKWAGTEFFHFKKAGWIALAVKDDAKTAEKLRS